MHHQPNPSRRKGFTVIELLVVVGILAVLAAIAVVGIGRIFEAQRRTQTRTVLSSVQSMLGEFDRETSLKRQPPHQWRPLNTLVLGTAATLDFWRDADPNTADFQGLADMSTLDLGEDNDDPSPSATNSRQHAAVVKNTQLAMFMFNQIGAVKKMLSAMPNGSLVTIVDDAATNAPPYDEHAVGVPKDAWGNTMILVPAAGLRGVFLAGDSSKEFVVTSVKTYPVIGAGSLPAGELAPGARPFFVSPGPDGRLNGFDATDTTRTYADDNLYSFEN